MRKDARGLQLRNRIGYRLLLPSMCLITGGCTLPGLVQRQTVEYNTAAAGMANQLVLLNIARAKALAALLYLDQPSEWQCRCYSRWRIECRSQDGLAHRYKYTTSTVVTTADGLPATTATTTLSALTHAVTSGGNLYTPSVTGQIVSGPSFDINILDTQQFYNGILQEVPMSTVETFVNRHFDNKLLMRLLIDRIELRWKESDEERRGQLLDTLYNAPSDTSYSISPESANPDMDALALLEELIDLQGTDRPVTVPVHVLQ